MSCDDISVNVLLRSLVVRLSGLLSVFTTGGGNSVFSICVPLPNCLVGFFCVSAQ